MAEIWGGWPRQILRTSCEEGPLPGAAHSWTWEGKAASPGRPSPTPHGVQAGEGSPLSSRAIWAPSSCVACHVHVFVHMCEHTPAASDAPICVHENSAKAPAGGLWFPWLRRGPGSCRCSDNRLARGLPWCARGLGTVLQPLSSGGPGACLLPQCPAVPPVPPTCSASGGDCFSQGLWTGESPWGPLGLWGWQGHQGVRPG